MERICNNCKISKPIEAFRPMKTNRDGIALVCRKCVNAQSRNLRHAKERAGNALIKEHKKNGLSKKDFESIEDYDNHIENLRREGIEKFIKEKPIKNVKKTIQWKRATSLRSQLRLLVRNLKPSKRVIEIVGCNHIELKQYLESKFMPDMSWDNYGKHGWHIDHIKPCKSFDLTKEEQIRECFNFRNLQPLWAKENWSKGFKHDTGI